MNYEKLRDRYHDSQGITIFKDGATVEDVDEITDAHIAHVQHMTRIFECPISVAFDLVQLAMEVAETHNGLQGRKLIADYMEDHARIAKFAVNRDKIKVVSNNE